MISRTAVIDLRGIRVHNLRSVNVDFPLGRLTVVIGVSGAGKSNLVFDTLFAESQRRYLQSFSASVRQLLEKFDEPEADWIGDLPPAIAIRSSDPLGSPDAIVADAADLDDRLARWFANAGVSTCPNCGRSVRPHAAAEVVHELMALPPGTSVTLGFPDAPSDGETTSAWAERLREDGWFRLKIGDRIVRLGEEPVPETNAGIVIVDRVAIGKTTAERLLESIEMIFRRGDGRLFADDLRFDRRWRCPTCDVPVAVPDARLFDPRDPMGACPDCQGVGGDCRSCHGQRFNDLALSVRIEGRSIADVLAMPLAKLQTSLPSPGASNASLGDIPEALSTLAAYGLGAIPLARRCVDLSSGETQRLRLWRASRVELTGALFLFEEPTAGLADADVAWVVGRLRDLRDAGNTVIAIDHSPPLWKAADWLVEIGPGAGAGGGRIVYQGPPDGLADCDESVSAAWLNDDDETPRPAKPSGEVRLKKIDVLGLADEIAFPLGVLCLVDGDTGVGKTRLLRDSLVPAFRDGANLQGARAIEEAVLFDGSPMPRSSRSNPATLLKVFDEIRELFAETTDARIRNAGAGAFSFNQPGGRCETCEGQGTLAVDMAFLADAVVTCPDCLGRRYRREILDIRVRGLAIDEVLDLSAREAFRFFRAQRSIEKKLKRLLDVGLDHLAIGQSLETLSTGEVQRLKLAAHLSKSRKPRSLFVLIEPTRGLHPEDVAGLIDCFRGLVSTGHSLIVEDKSPLLRRAADAIVTIVSHDPQSV